MGPIMVKLLDQATLDLPDGFVYLNQEATNNIMERLGNRKDERTIGGIFPKNVSEAKYFLLVEWDAVGYVKDDEADKLDAKKILESIREGTEEGNKFRAEKGLPPVEVVGWDEPPRYDQKRRHIVWAIRGRSKSGDTVNFNTRLLGRAGYLSLNLICGPEQLPALKDTVEGLLKNVSYQDGKRYTDFIKGKDKVSDLGLAALVVGGAALAGKAVKLGLLAKFGQVLLGLLLALKKAIVLFLVGIGAYLRRLFGGKTPLPPPSASEAEKPDTAERPPTPAPAPAPSAAAAQASPPNPAGSPSSEEPQP